MNLSFCCQAPLAEVRRKHIVPSCCAGAPS